MAVSEQTQLTEFAEEEREQDAASVEEIRERYADGEIGDRELEEQLEQVVETSDDEGTDQDDAEADVEGELLEVVFLGGLLVTFLAFWFVVPSWLLAWITGLPMSETAVVWVFWQVALGMDAWVSG